VLPVVLDPERILPDEIRPERGDDGCDGLRIGPRSRLARPDDPGIGLDLDHAIRAALEATASGDEHDCQAGGDVWQADMARAPEQHERDQAGKKRKQVNTPFRRAE
jgi:hypothetical protein